MPKRLMVWAGVPSSHTGRMKITDAEKKALKGRGYIMTRDGEHFVGRIITEDGVYGRRDESS